jgi:type I restriction-modification system DNA methylase subunit
VRRFDYEALFQPSFLDELVPLPAPAQTIIRALTRELAAYDWDHLRDDILGSIFEHLIPREEQLLLGQFYTPTHVADFVVAFAVSGGDSAVLDPGCGSGTFLMRAYDFVREQTKADHSDLLSRLWGFDISPFAAELAAINLFRQDMSVFNNFPRVIPGSFFDRHPGEEIPFPPPRLGGPEKILIQIPKFSALIGNPPYLRSQNQDDLDPKYKAALVSAAVKNGVKPSSKSDLFTFFIYNALKFMEPGSRLGFVTSASWLTADFGRVLQELLLGRLRLIAVVGSSSESFFSQVDVNTVLLIAEYCGDSLTDAEHKLRFVMLKQRLVDLFPQDGDYWKSLLRFADEVDNCAHSTENDRVRITVVDAKSQRDQLGTSKQSLNWSIFLRAPLSYYDIYGEP